MAKDEEHLEHRGRFQAQGGGIEESESWAQDNPLSVSKARILFRNFLQDRRAYSLNKYYWNRLVKTIGQEKIRKTDVYQNFYADGQSVSDGNPIYSALLNDHKSIRIIQEEHESDSPEIGAWMSSANELNGQLTEELVISLELTTITREVAKGLIKFWFQPETDAERMEKYITAQLSLVEA